jgi:DNA-binding response OmpR family regulator
MLSQWRATKHEALHRALIFSNLTWNEILTDNAMGTIGRMSDKKRILVVEDETPLACWMISVLTQIGCDVEAARTGKRAMELATENQYDLITLDIGLPDVSGFVVCVELKQRHISRHTPIVFISASSREEDRQQSLKLGAVDYIEKPFDPRNFVGRLLSRIDTELVASESPFEQEFP